MCVLSLDVQSFAPAFGIDALTTAVKQDLEYAILIATSAVMEHHAGSPEESPSNAIRKASKARERFVSRLARCLQAPPGVAMGLLKMEKRVIPAMVWSTAAVPARASSPQLVNAPTRTHAVTTVDFQAQPRCAGSPLVRVILPTRAQEQPAIVPSINIKTLEFRVRLREANAIKEAVWSHLVMRTVPIQINQSLARQISS